MLKEKLSRAYLVAVREKRLDIETAELELDEFTELTLTLGLEIVGKTLQRVQQYHPKYYMGAGLAESLKQTLNDLNAGLLLVDGELSPVQERNLEVASGAKVYTRTDVILEIFARRAGTREGKLQVELARLEYALPRMVGMWTHFGRIAGGIGGRAGAGETQLEIDRRRARSRIAQVKRELESVRQVRAEHRKKRTRNEMPTFSLVGYTNAGKSSLLNQLTGTAAPAANRMFETLDPLTERLVLPGKQTVLVTDTVGFIRSLPHTLVDAFRATLEEVEQADVLLHVVDGSDPEMDEKIKTVREVLEQIGAGASPCILVINKADCPPPPHAHGPEALNEMAIVRVSARTGAGIDTLLAAMQDAIAARMRRLKIRVPYTEGKALAEIVAAGEIFAREDEDESVVLDVRLNHVLAGRYREFIIPDRIQNVGNLP